MISEWAKPAITRTETPVAWRTKNQWNAWVATTSDIVATGWAESGRKVEPLYLGAPTTLPSQGRGGAPSHQHSQGE